MSFSDIVPVLQLYIKNLPYYGSSLNIYNPTRPFYEHFYTDLGKVYTTSSNYLLAIIEEIHNQCFQSIPLYYFFDRLPNDPIPVSDEQIAEIRAEVRRLITEHNARQCRL
jgi:hypothetical protein